MKLAVILPSRGQIFSQTVDELLENLQGYNYKLFWSHGRPIPDCFNMPTEEALADPTITHLWFVEEDMILPPDTLKAMLKLRKPAVACDYPLIEDGGGTILYDPDGKAFFSGTGCLLVRREVLESLSKPIWRSDIFWAFKTSGPFGKFEAKRWDKEAEKVYGYHDIHFGLRLYMRGTPIEVCQVECGQRKLVKRGAENTNLGSHGIVEYRKLVRQDHVSHGIPLVKEALMEVVMLKDQSEIRMKPKLAKNLIKAGLARPKQVGYAIISCQSFPELNQDMLVGLK